MVDMKDVPSVKLDPKSRKDLEKLQPDLLKARKALETLKKLGMDVSSAEEKLDWAENARNIILTEFD